MWYFTWILGVLLAVAAGIVNALWLETQPRRADLDDDERD
jgi:cyd operon protein YbgT